MKRLVPGSFCCVHGNRGSTFVVVLGFVAVLSVTFGAVLSRTMNTHRKVSHIATWQEALIAADAGGETAMAELRKTIADSTQPQSFVGWDLYPDAQPNSTKIGPVLPGTGRATIRALTEGKSVRFTPPKLVHDGEGNTEMDMTVMVDAPPSLVDPSGKQWFRVRATGTTYLPGANLLAGDRRDLRLRRLSFHRDGKLNQAVTRPQTTRSVEMIVKPIGLEPAIFSREPIDMNNANIIVNSYDSRSPLHSVNGLYHDSIAGAEGDIATNSSLIDAGNAQIFGDAYTNDGQVINSANIKGEIDNEYYLEVDSKTTPSVYDPWPIASYTTVPANSIGGGATVTAGVPGGPPKRIKLGGAGTMNITGGDITFAPIDPAAPGGDVEVWVPGDMKTAGTGGIVVGPGVNVRIYVEGSIYIGGNGNWNANSQPAKLQVFGILYKGTGQIPAVTIAGNGIIVAAIYAPDHPVEFKATGSGGQVWGSIFGKSIIMGGSTHIHYDRALAEAGRTTDFRIKSWFEDNSY